MHAAFAIFFAPCIIQLFKGKVQNTAKIELFNISLERYYPSTLTFCMYFAQIWRTSDENCRKQNFPDFAKTFTVKVSSRRKQSNALHT